MPGKRFIFKFSDGGEIVITDGILQTDYLDCDEVDAAVDGTIPLDYFEMNDFVNAPYGDINYTEDDFDFDDPQNGSQIPLSDSPCPARVIFCSNVEILGKIYNHVVLTDKMTNLGWDETTLENLASENILDNLDDWQNKFQNLADELNIDLEIESTTSFRDWSGGRIDGFYCKQLMSGVKANDKLPQEFQTLANKLEAEAHKSIVTATANTLNLAVRDATKIVDCA